MSDWKPVGRSDVRSRQQGEELALADPDNSKVHFLNETAEFIWELCDGEHTLGDIEAEIRACFDVPPEADLRAATAAAELAGQRGDPALIEPLLGTLRAWDVMGRRRPVRLAALQALGRIGRPEALPRLGRFFRDWGPFPARAERRVAYESLHGYPAEARAALVRRGLRSRDSEIRAVCERLRQSG